jgi:hypothetical protein
MPISMKKRYPRGVRFRKIASNNNQTQQVRRFELVPTISIVGQVVTFTFDRPVTILSNAADITGIVDQVPVAPTSIAYHTGTTSAVDLTFPGAAPTSVTVPFEDPAIRDQIGAYIRPGVYEGGG